MGLGPSSPSLGAPPPHVYLWPQQDGLPGRAVPCGMQAPPEPEASASMPERLCWQVIWASGRVLTLLGHSHNKQQALVPVFSREAPQVVVPGGSHQSLM